METLKLGSTSSSSDDFSGGVWKYNPQILNFAAFTMQTFLCQYLINPKDFQNLEHTEEQQQKNNTFTNSWQ